MTPREKLELLRSYRAAGGTGSYISLIKEAKQYSSGGPKKKINLPELPIYLPEPPVAESTGIINKHKDIPIKLQNYYKEPPILKQDDATPAHREITKKFKDSMENPTPMEVLGEGLQGLYRYTANPTKILGDAGEIVADVVGRDNILNRNFPNTREDVFQSRYLRHNPFISNELRNKIQAEEFKNLTLNTLQNAALAELGYLSPQISSIPTLTKTLSTGSRANLASNMIQLYDTDWKELSNFNPDELGNFILNSAGIIAKTGGNFNTGDAIIKLAQGNFLPTYRALSRSDKIDLLKDVTSHTENILSQGQRFVLGGFNKRITLPVKTYNYG